MTKVSSIGHQRIYDDTIKFQVQRIHINLRNLNKNGDMKEEGKEKRREEKRREEK